jgi:hypothetical protein
MLLVCGLALLAAEFGSGGSSQRPRGRRRQSLSLSTMSPAVRPLLALALFRTRETPSTLRRAEQTCPRLARPCDEPTPSKTATTSAARGRARASREASPSPRVEVDPLVVSERDLRQAAAPFVFRDPRPVHLGELPLARRLRARALDPCQMFLSLIFLKRERLGAPREGRRARRPGCRGRAPPLEPVETPPAIVVRFPATYGCSTIGNPAALSVAMLLAACDGSHETRRSEKRLCNPRRCRSSIEEERERRRLRREALQPTQASRRWRVLGACARVASTYRFVLLRGEALRGSTCGGSSPDVVECALRI